MNELQAQDTRRVAYILLGIVDPLLANATPPLTASPECQRAHANALLILTNLRDRIDATLQVQ